MGFARINVSTTDEAKEVFLKYQRSRDFSDQNSAMTALLLEVKDFLKNKER